MASARPDRALGASEHSPLLPTQSRSPSRASEYSRSSSEDDDAPPVPDAAERRKSTLRWVAFWLVFAAVLGIAVGEAFREGETEFDWKGALKKAAGGGLSGAMAMVVQVFSLMPLRTIMNYQYRFGGTFTGAASTLHESGGFWRYYSGLGAAIFQGPLARFGDTAANTGINALLDSNPVLNRLPSPLKTAFGSVAGAGFRMILVPIDTIKTTLQTEGQSGRKLLRERVKLYGLGSLWYGAWATAAASFVGSFPWFAVYNWLDKDVLHPVPREELGKLLLRQAFIGFCASAVSDTVSNSLRVVKTYRQVHDTPVSYTQAAQRIVRREGMRGLFGRGLKTRILSNGLQGLLFSVLWKLFASLLESKQG